MNSATWKLTAALSAMLTATSLLAATAEVGGMTYEYTISNGKATITKVTGDNKVVIVPDTLGGYTVTTLRGGAFSDNMIIQRVSIPETVTTLTYSSGYDGGVYHENGVFSGCSLLNTCNIPSGVTAIPERCFFNCTRLHGVILPTGLKSIGSTAFAACSSLDKIDFPEGLTSVGSSAFSGCSSLKEVMLPDSVASLGSYAFRSCTSLVKAHLPSGLNTIPSWIFEGCSNLLEVNIPSGVTTIASAAFQGCSSLREIVVPATVTQVDSGLGERVVFLGRPPAGLAVSTAVFPKEYGELWQMHLSINQRGGFVKLNKPVVEIVSAAVRTNDSTVLDVVYKVTSAKPTVKVRALAFEDGVRSLAKVTRPETFIDGTAANIGDVVAANVEHTLSWRVSADFHTDLAKMVMEIFAVEDDILPLELMTIPANGGNRAMELSWNCLADFQIYEALLWLYADGDAGLTLASGTLKNGNTTLASGTSLYKTSKKVSGQTIYYYPANAYVFSKMGFSELSGDALSYANSMTRLGLSPGTSYSAPLRQYAYRWIDAE